MKITLKEAIDIQRDLSALFPIGLPVKLSLQVARASRKIAAEIEAPDSVRVSVLQKYKKGMEGNTFVPPEPGDENYAEFEAEFNEIMQTEIALDIVERFDLSKLDRLNVVITPGHVSVLDELNEKMAKAEDGDS